MDDIKIGSNKSFGIVFFLVFLLISTYPLINNENVRYWSLFVSLIFLILGLLNSAILSSANKLWFKFGILLGKIVSPLVMIIIYFFMVTPIGLLMKLFKKDLLNFTSDDKKKTYWIEKTEPKSKMKNQF